MQMAFLHFPPRVFQEHARIIAPDVQIEILEPGQSFKPARV